MRLYQLPTGTWINVDQVESIEAKKESGCPLTGDKSPDRVRITMKSGFSHFCDCKDFEEAKALRDGLAIEIADETGRSKQ